jgi:NADH-quinone oxidoreductase subunit M
MANFLFAVSQLASPLPALERRPWIPAIGAEFYLALDGASLLLVILTALVFLLAVLASPAKPRSFYALLLLVEGAAMGVFLAHDLLLFFICFEAVLIPMYFLIAVWGGAQRQRASLQFVLFTALGSVALLVGILTLYWQSGAQLAAPTFDFDALATLQLEGWISGFTFWALLIGFGVKVPMLPLHGWLPDAHTEAPTAASAVLAAVLLKMGTYGIFRVALPLAPAQAKDPWSSKALLFVSVVAILYGGLVSLAQTDAKRLVAYSSISHLGFCTLGLFTLNGLGVAGSLLQQLNHGISTALLFFLVGFLYDRRGTRDLAEFGGLAKPMPRMSVAFGIAILGSAGLPLLNGFVGEFTILRGAYQSSAILAGVAALGIIVAAAYLLVLFQKVMLGPIKVDANRSLPDLTVREWMIVLPLIGWSIWIGISPAGHFRLLEQPVNEFLRTVAR